MADIERKRKKSNVTLAVITAIVFIGLIFTIRYVASNTSKKMQQSAVSNLSESLNLLTGSMEAMLQKEMELQKIMANELAKAEDPKAWIQDWKIDEGISLIACIEKGKQEGITNRGDSFTAEGLEFSEDRRIGDMELSASYVNDMGMWSYVLRCPIEKEGEETATLYVEHMWEMIEDFLPKSYYNGEASVYVLDQANQRFILKPKKISDRYTNYINMEDLYTANGIDDWALQNEIAAAMRMHKNYMFYHKINKQDSLVYMWEMCDGNFYVCGFVPITAIQREGETVNRAILMIVGITVCAFLICCGLYYSSRRMQIKIRRAQEAEREKFNVQLQEALEAAQSASRSKTTFLSNMSHDIRTPMNAILGFTTLLMKDAGNEAKVREYTRKITASGQHLLSLINDVLDISKIESGKMALSLAQFSLDEMMEAVDTIIRPQAKAKKQSFHVSVRGVKHEQLIGDETRINQVLINLLSNAVKYTQEGGEIHLRVSGLEQRSRQFEHIRMEVSDNGYGMTPEYLKVIFDAFTRAENSTTNKVQGTGLGMAITKNIVELMGGTIKVSSEVGKGTTFTVELELRIPEAPVDSHFWTEHGISRILVADGEEEVRSNIQSLMEPTGVTVDGVRSCSDALKRIEAAWKENRDYDLVLLGQKLVDSDGIETAGRIRDLEIPAQPILLLMAYEWEESAEKEAQGGPDGFLVTPFFVSKFKEKILEIKTEQRRQDKKETQAAEQEEDGYSLQGMHFLVAEDNEINAEILSELLEMEGATCEIMENGQLVTQQFERSEPQKYTAILMDVQMPVMNGYEAARAIRAMTGNPEGATIPIIAMTANAFVEDVKEAMEAGMTAHVSKPIDMEILKQTIHNIRKTGE